MFSVSSYVSSLVSEDKSKSKPTASTAWAKKPRSSESDSSTKKGSSKTGRPPPSLLTQSLPTFSSAAPTKSIPVDRRPIEWRTIVFIRHGASLWNESTDSALTNPIAAAKAMGKGMREYATWKWRTEEYKHEESEMIDTPLSEGGLKQAYNLSEFLKAHIDLRMHEMHNELMKQQMIASPLKDAYRCLKEYASHHQELEPESSLPIPLQSALDSLDIALLRINHLMTSVVLPQTPVHSVRSTSQSFRPKTLSSLPRLDSSDFEEGDEQEEQHSLHSEDSGSPSTMARLGSPAARPMAVSGGESSSSSMSRPTSKSTIVMPMARPIVHQKSAPSSTLSAGSPTLSLPSSLNGRCTSEERRKLFGSGVLLKPGVRNDLPLNIGYILDLLCATQNSSTATMLSSDAAGGQLGSERVVVACSNLRRAISTCVLGLWPRFKRTKAINEKVFVLSCLQEIGINLDTHTLTAEYSVPRVSAFESRQMNIDARALSNFYDKRLETIFNFGPKSEMIGGIEDESEMLLRLEVFAKWVFMSGHTSYRSSSKKRGKRPSQLGSAVLESSSGFDSSHTLPAKLSMDSSEPSDIFHKTPKPATTKTKPPKKLRLRSTKSGTSVVKASEVGSGSDAESVISTGTATSVTDMIAAAMLLQSEDVGELAASEKTEAKKEKLKSESVTVKDSPVRKAQKEGSPEDEQHDQSLSSTSSSVMTIESVEESPDLETQSMIVDGIVTESITPDIETTSSMTASTMMTPGSTSTTITTTGSGKGIAPTAFIITGHSAWLRHFFNQYLPKESNPYGCKKRKLSNCGVVAFRFAFDPNNQRFFIAPETVTVVYGGFGAG